MKIDENKKVSSLLIVDAHFFVGIIDYWSTYYN